MKFDHKKLLQWFKENRRPFPWRESPTPYSVWVSEVMLQQTQSKAVIPYFERWMEVYPTIQELAKAPLEEVIKLWEGLGYYSRVRNLHEGARQICTKFAGEFPKTAEQIASIKGLGKYTTGAILNFAYQKKAAAVDGNVFRVLTRLFAIEEDISKGKTQKLIWEIAEKILPDKHSWIHSEALIELGATVCQKKPQCQRCPLNSSCLAFQQGKTSQIPFKSKKHTITKLYRAVAIIQCQEKVLLRKVEEGEIMSGLHEFPYFDIDEELSTNDFQKKIASTLKLKTDIFKKFPPVQHSFTRYQVTLYPTHFIAEESPSIRSYLWVPLKKIPQLAFPSGHRHLAQFLHCTVQERHPLPCE